LRTKRLQVSARLTLKIAGKGFEDMKWNPIESQHSICIFEGTTILRVISRLDLSTCCVSDEGDKETYRSCSMTEHNRIGERKPGIECDGAPA
jgi:hypothetical protein